MMNPGKRHLDLSNALMNFDRPEGHRRLLSDADILAIAQLGGYEIKIDTDHDGTNDLAERSMGRNPAVNEPSVVGLIIQMMFGNLP